MKAHGSSAPELASSPFPDEGKETAEPSYYVFYDIEATGLSSRYDQPLEIGAVLCDHDLVPIDSFCGRCDSLPWIVPSPQPCCSRA